MRYLFPLIFLIAAAFFGTYGYLGGFSQPTVALETTAAPVFLAGQPFEGSAQSEAFGQLFRQAKDAQDQHRLRGDLANLYYDNPERATDTLRAFVGLAVADTTQALPPGFRYRVVPAGRHVVAAHLSGVNFLLSPNKLYPAVQDFIKEKKLTQQGMYFERFAADERATVWAEVR